MNILVDIGHPAHVHIFKNIAHILISKGHSVFFTVREGEKETDLLLKYDLQFSTIGRKKRSLFGKVSGLLIFSFKIFRLSQKLKSDLFLSHGSMYAGMAAFLRNKPHIALEDTGNMEQMILSKPFSNIILSPDSLRVNLGKKHHKYRGFHELFYLSPKFFNADREVKSLLGIKKKDKFCIVRFISWGATHDHGYKGLTVKGKADLIDYLNGKCKVFISSESELPPDLEQYKFPLTPEWLHHAIAYSEIVITEGATIASESTLLGIPVVYINSRESDLIDEHEKWGLLTHYRKFDGVIEKISEIINDFESRSKNFVKRDEMLKNKIDVTSFLLWVIECYPESARVMEQDPDFQKRFEL